MAETFFLYTFFHLDKNPLAPVNSSQWYYFLGGFCAETHELKERFRKMVLAEVLSRLIWAGYEVVTVSEEELANEESVPLDYRVKAKVISRRLLDATAEEIQKDNSLYLAAYARDLAKELGIQVPAVPLVEEDGPYHLYTWRQDGEKLPDKVFQRATWNLINLLWKSPDRSASFTDLSEPVFGDHALDPDSGQVGKQRTLANKFFEGNRIPWKVVTSPQDRLVWLVKASP